MKINVAKSDEQIRLEKQGCIFNGQDLLELHQSCKPDECYRKPNPYIVPYKGDSILNALFGDGFI